MNCCSASSCMKICFLQDSRVRNVKYGRNVKYRRNIKCRPYPNHKEWWSLGCFMRAKVFRVIIICILHLRLCFQGGKKYPKHNPTNIPSFQAGTLAICPLHRSWPLSDIYGLVFIIVSRDPVCSLSSPCRS